MILHMESKQKSYWNFIIQKPSEKLIYYARDTKVYYKIMILHMESKQKYYLNFIIQKSIEK